MSGALLILTACAPDEDQPRERESPAEPPAPETTAAAEVPSEEPPEETHGEEGSDVLTVEPGCVEPDGEFTVRAEGLDPGTPFMLGYDPAPTPELEATIEAPVGDDGVLEVPAVLPAATDPEPGEYTLYLAEAPEGERMAEARLEIAESC